MKRREFITLLGGAAASPFAARAQQPREHMRRVGVLMHLAADDPEGQSRVAAFLQGLQEAGWAVGRNVNIDVRWAAGEAECPGGLEIDHKLELGRLLDRQVGRPCAFEDAIDVG